jgi:hypothetical protein
MAMSVEVARETFFYWGLQIEFVCSKLVSACFSKSLSWLFSLVYLPAVDLAGWYTHFHLALTLRLIGTVLLYYLHPVQI